MKRTTILYCNFVLWISQRINNFCKFLQKVTDITCDHVKKIFDNDDVNQP